MPGRVKASLEGNSTKVSKDLASAIFTYGIEDFTLRGEAPLNMILVVN